MKCPVCGKGFIEKNFGDVIVEVCENGCKSIWFDWFELSKLDENVEGFGDALKEALKAPRQNDSDREQLICPKCNIKMQRHPYKRAVEVTIDECYSCNGILLDSGELKEIRDVYMSNQDIENYTSSLVKSVPEYEMRKIDIETKIARNEAIGKFTNALRVSYWKDKISGKK